ncbi:hypothetical protein F8B43_0521 [Methylorubrum populi]|uniref:Uncharacterized protein n=1 Tax=Methylorubrum populi TaxID=223967 RepID=A0A833J9P0_9HYPH|nr:hypothetical protein F8B43_0521 [Methylorubrum populi]
MIGRQEPGGSETVASVPLAVRAVVAQERPLPREAAGIHEKSQ